MFSKKDYLYGIGLYGTRGLKEFLDTRPKDEEMGETLDHFKSFLEAKGELTDDLEKDIRSQHLAYLSDLLDSDIPLKVVSDPQNEENYLVREFCEEAEDVLYIGKLDNDSLIDFLEKYKDIQNPYISVNIALTLIRYRRYVDAFPFIKNSLISTFSNLNRYWDNKEAIFAYATFLYSIIVTLGDEGLRKIDDVVSSFQERLIEYTYLILSRVICWPENDDHTIVNDMNLPITYTDRISILLKRANLILSYENHFLDIIPSYSTPGSLAVSDFSLAHDFSFAEGVLGLKSQFKRDAKDLYATFEESHIRPFNTAINDGKKDSVELAHRFYLKYTSGKYRFNEYTINIMLDVLKKSYIKKLSSFNDKRDKSLICKYLNDNHIEYFYHFTEVENIPNIKKYGGLFSQRQCLMHSIPIKTIGDMRRLREKDASFYLEDYVRLSFCKFHPLIKYREQSGANLVLLIIKPDVAWFEETLFSDMDAALDNHHHGGCIDDLKRINIEAISQSNLPCNHALYAQNQAEVMVHYTVPIEYIMNIEKPIFVKNTLYV